MSQNALPSAEADTLPLVSVIIPAYNAENFIAKTLASVVAQTYRRLEILVVDDGSSDRTQSIVQTMAQQDPRIKLFKQANAGVAAARNAGIDKAKGEYIAPIDADDLWHPETLEKLLIPFDRGGTNLAWYQSFWLAIGRIQAACLAIFVRWRDRRESCYKLSRKTIPNFLITSIVYLAAVFISI